MRSKEVHEMQDDCFTADHRDLCHIFGHQLEWRLDSCGRAFANTLHLSRYGLPCRLGARSVGMNGR